MAASCVFIVARCSIMLNLTSFCIVKAHSVGFENGSSQNLCLHWSVSPIISPLVCVSNYEESDLSSDVLPFLPAMVYFCFP